MLSLTSIDSRHMGQRALLYTRPPPSVAPFTLSPSSPTAISKHLLAVCSIVRSTAYYITLAQSKVFKMVFRRHGVHPHVQTIVHALPPSQTENKTCRKQSSHLARTLTHSIVSSTNLHAAAYQSVSRCTLSSDTDARAPTGLCICRLPPTWPPKPLPRDTIGPWSAGQWPFAAPRDLDSRCAVREMGGATRNLAPRNHLFVWTVKSSGCHCTDAFGGKEL